MVTEKWRTTSIDSRYEVSSEGRIRFNGQIVEPHTANSGYHTVYLKSPTGLKVLVHRLVCEAFHGPSELPTVNHKDGVKKNNASDNLEWATHKDNYRHALDSGLAKKVGPPLKGHLALNSSLRPEDVLAIRENKEKLTGVLLAKRYCVSPSTISSVIRGLTYTGPEYWPQNPIAAVPNPRSQITHCIRGHEFTVENTIFSEGHRKCRECKRIRQRERYTEQAAKRQSKAADKLPTPAQRRSLYARTDG